MAGKRVGGYMHTNPKGVRGFQPAPRVPLAPLEAAMRNVGIRQMGPRLGVMPNTLSRWRREGALNVWAADQAAITLGMHPLEIWPDFYADVDLDTDDDELVA